MIYINICRRNDISVSCFQIIAYAIKLYGGDIKETIKAYKCWVHRFLSLHNLSIRKVSHIGQKVPKDLQNITYRYLNKIMNAGKITKIEDNIELIINVDETHCYLDNPSTEKVDIKGKKNIEITFFDRDKCRITAVLSESSSGY